MVSLPSNLPSKSTIHVGKDPTRWALPAISSIITPRIGVKEPPVTDIFSAIYRSCNSMYNDRRCPPCMGKAISEGHSLELGLDVPIPGLCSFDAPQRHRGAICATLAKAKH